MKKEFLLVIILAIIIIGLAVVLLWPKPANVGPTQKPVVIEGIQVTLPKENANIVSPLKITGITNGAGWNGFEGQVGTVKLLDSKGKQLGETAILSAKTEWTKPPVTFETNLNFISTEAQNGTLVFSNENPSGLPDKNKQFAVPVKIGKISDKNMTIKVYFSLANADSDCKTVFSVDRIIAQTSSPAKAAIEELLKGPTLEEKARGSVTSIPANSKLNSISIVNGEARADFNAVTESGGGSCSMASRVAQINKTLMQFSTIKSVKLSINGRTGDIFQP